MESPSHNPDRYEDQLAATQARRLRIIQLLAALLVTAGLCALGWAAWSGLGGEGSFAIILVFGLAGLAAIAAGTSLLLRSRASATEDDSFDDFLSRFAPRIIGGQKQETLDSHQRRQRRRR